MAIFIVFLIIIFGGILISIPIIRARRRNIWGIIEQWAKEKNLEIVEYSESYTEILKAFIPFSKNQHDYRYIKIHVNDQAKKRRTAILEFSRMASRSDQINCVWKD